MTAFATRRQFSAKPAAVFAAISDPARLARWWGPAGFSNRFDVFEFRPGGKWVFTMVGPDGREYANESVFARIDEGREVIIDHVCAPLFQLSIALAPVAQGTLLAWTQTFGDAAVAQAVAPIVIPANEQNLDRLAAELGVASMPVA
ncbi:MAG: SRPBCC domain-containing protein [Rhodocyclaceae bacterium]